jgi:raffinose/stachyose/melibiose transport system permease protein
MERRLNVILKRIRSMKPVLFVLPALVFYVIFTVIPILRTLQFSFFRWDGVSPVMTFVGLEQYARLLRDPIFWKALGHNILWIVATIVLPMFLGLVLAVLVQSKQIKGGVFFRTAYFIPGVISLVAVGIVWNWIYHPDFGVVNDFLRSIGLEQFALDWLGNESTVMWALIITGGWTYFGFCRVIFLAALQGIDRSYYEVAKLEGAGPIQTFRLVTIPMLRNTFTLLVLYSMIGSFKVFDLVYMMTKGGPYHSSEVIATYMFKQAFEMNDVGYGSAISIMLALLTTVCSIGYLRLLEKDD